MTDRLQISKLKVVKSHSFETLCFTAELSFDGKVIATVKNQGTGGPNFFRAKPGCVELLRAAEEYAKSLPAEKSDFGDLPMDLDFAIGLIVEEQNRKAELKKEFQKVAKKCGFIRNGQIFTFPIKVELKDSPERRELFARIHSQRPGIQILAEMEESVAFEKFCEIMK